jgi:hypothetical protein
VNEVFRKIERSAHLRGRVKIVGIGVGNSDYEVAFFQQTYNVPFPLFADRDFSIHNRLGKTRTPYFIGARKTEQGGYRVYLSRLGGAGDGEALFKQLLEGSGLM